MQDREVSCMYYEYEGGCSKGKEGTFRKACQTCKEYKAKKGSLPARKNLKRQKMNEIQKSEMKKMIRDY